MPTAGSVGSWFGLYPYSSTSFRRSSSVSLFALCLPHHHSSRQMITATETTGTTTATAIVPPADRPPVSSELGNEGADEGTAVPVTELVSEPVLTGSLTVPVFVMTTVVREDVIVMVD